MNKTNINYLTHTWNPLAMRCDRISEACENCWHLTMADRLAKNPKISEDRRKAYVGGDPILIEKELNAPMELKKPAVIGLQFMGDLFHENIQFEHIHEIWDVIKACPQHVFLVLTKRPKRMLDAIGHIYKLERLGWAMGFWQHTWLGITAENQERADERIPILLQIPAVVRFISVEPMLSKIDLSHLPESGAELDLVICGTESGPKRRPAQIEWIRDLKDQCVAAGVPFFLKQIEINSKVSHQMDEWPEDLMKREFPAHGLHDLG